MRRDTKPGAELQHGGIFTVALDSLRPAAMNDKLYRPVDVTDPAMKEFARGIGETIRVAGLEAIDPIVITTDDVIVSGHRRRGAYLILAVKRVRVRRVPVTSDDPRFGSLLAAFNAQRDKSADEVFREELVRLNPAEARQQLLAHRRAAAAVRVETMTITGVKTRAAISGAKGPFLKAVCDVTERLRPYWPLSDRLVHYQLLNAPPLKHASKPDSRYANDTKSYNSLTELITRLRLNGTVPFEAIHDPTRPVTLWRTFPSVREFVREELREFLRNYWRDLQRSQPLHVEIVAEKNTLEGTLRPVAMEYTVPFMIGRGYSSIPPRRDLVRRFEKSGKDKLLILFVSDCDPEGDDIAHRFARSIRDDFGVTAVEAVKVALTRTQAKDLRLPPLARAKTKSSRRRRFVETHGSDHVWELEAVPPDRLQQILRTSIEGVLDMNLFRREEAREAEDATDLDTTREQMRRFLATNFTDLDRPDGIPD